MKSGGPGYIDISQKALTTARLLEPHILHKRLLF